ncbi:MAG: tellurite resistance TerB family protein [Rhodocyclaceae bacterium]|jgi:uncharacterized membrane protein YebE (DUF533 family)|nr:tellurite resistance TerB family protein [Rhodocyclaceae bacterium]
MINQDWKKLLEQGLSGTGLSGQSDGKAGKGKGLLDQLMSSGVGGGLLGGVLGGMLAGSKGGRKLVGNAAKLGGIAAVGALAYSAYQRYRQQQAGTQVLPQGEVVLPPQDSGFLPPPDDELGQGAMRLAVVRAMIAAAKADGHIDDAERDKIFAQIGQLGLDAEEKAFLFDELARPLDIDAIVRLGISPEVSAELYTASVLTINTDTAAERAYLQMLAARLQLDPALVSQIHAAVEGA